MSATLKAKPRSTPSKRGPTRLRKSTPEITSPDARHHRLITFALAVSLALATLAVYHSVGSHPFIDYDDHDYVTNNSHVKAGLTWDTFTWAWTSTQASNWHPVTWLSHAADCELHGLNPSGHHWTNLLLHTLNVALVFLLLERVTGARWRSLFAAALFALHPLNVESVAWIAERKNVLSTLFFLSALGAYGWYAAKPGVKRYLVVAAFFALGLAAKPMVITLPFVFLLMDFWPLQRVQGWGPATASRARAGKRKQATEDEAIASPLGLPSRPVSRLLLEKLPLFIFLFASAIITVIAQRSSAIRSLSKIPMDERLENALYSYALYIWKAFWPTRLALFYPHPTDTLTGWQLGLAFLFLFSVTALVWNQRSVRPYLVTGWLWYLGTLVPVIGIVQVGDQAMADRYAYIPLIGIFVMVVWGIGDWADGRNVNVGLRWAASVAVLAALSFLTWRQIGYWRSDIDVW